MLLIHNNVMSIAEFDETPDASPPAVPLGDALRSHRKKLIVDAARTVFEERGLDGASIRAIAQRAGCTTGAIYPHFDGKEEIFAQVLSESLDGLRDTGEDAVRAAPSPARGLRRATLAVYKYYEDRPADFALALYLFNGVRPRELGGGLDDGLAQRLQSVVDLLAAEISVLSRPAFPPMVAVEAMALFTYLTGILTLRHSGRMTALEKNAAVLLAHYTSNLVKRLGRGASA